MEKLSKGHPMAPAEQEFIALWNEGLEIAAIAQRLGIPKGTVQSRAHRLQLRGMIQPRPKGGAYPRQKVKARMLSDGTPAQAPASPPADSVLPTRDPPAPAPARVDIEQWTVRLSKALIARIKAEAAAAEKPPSHLLEELAWKALNDQSPSRP